MMERQNSGRIQRVRHELKMREVDVVKVEPLGEGFVSVTFRGDDLQDFVSASFDDHVKIMFPGPDGETVKRDYTPRRFDREERTLEIEFALHGPGAASDWARQAMPGQRIVIGGPRGSFVVPLDFDWYVMAADDSGVPAMRRFAEELPAGRQAAFIVNGGHTGFHSAGTVNAQHVDDDAALVKAIDAFEFPAGEGFVWCAAEADTARQVREVLQRKGLPREASRVSAYWKRGAADHHEDL